jgi:hypothetical protein
MVIEEDERDLKLIKLTIDDLIKWYSDEYEVDTEVARERVKAACEKWINSKE